MDFNVYALNKILAALYDLNDTIKRTKTYRDANIFTFNCEAIVEVSQLSGVLGILGVFTQLVGSADGIADVKGLLSVITELEGLLIDSTSDVSGLLNVITKLECLVNATTEVAGMLGGTTRRLIGTPIDSIASGEAEMLRVDTGLEGLIQAGSTVTGWLTGV